ncbi:MAG: hypothetical protein K9N47_29450 [Prosthecobacter sp.]|uniref:hypothetical protein n=1 Tax=Prosthecobacter sp. TaxID=1965333 RepID=UPI00260530A5|nr:hypothetical protein [Prosthecobacter sp.]MCF7790282.1 hypothetical protein [Prosthecobacter sp.]
MRLILFLLISLSVVLAFTNPNEAEFRSYMQKKHGIAGSLSLKVASIFSAGTSTGVSRDNYIICSRYYIGGDGILPRVDLAWGVGGKFFDIDEDDEK